MIKKIFLIFYFFLNYLLNQAQQSPVACFTGDANLSNGQCTLMLLDKSLCYPIDWTWSIPGALPSSSNLQNPFGFHYNTPGIYDITLTVNNPWGTSTVTKVGVMNAYTCHFDTTIGTCISVDCSADVPFYENKINTIEIFPNPIIDCSIMKINIPIIKKTEVIFYNYFGQRIKSSIIKEQSYEICHFEFVKGLYLYQILENDIQIGDGMLYID